MFSSISVLVGPVVLFYGVAALSKGGINNAVKTVHQYTRTNILIDQVNFVELRN